MQNFLTAIETFISLGNTVSGAPKRVSDVFQIAAESGGSHIEFGEGCQLGDTAITMERGGGRLVVGQGASIRGRYNIGPGSSVNLGENVVMNRHSMVVAQEGASIFIGADSLLSNVSISTTDWHSIIDADTDERINPARDIRVGSRVWLGEDVTLQKGADIGDDCVIGSKSLVTGKIPDGCLAVGSPARVIRERIKWRRDLIPMENLPVKEARLSISPDAGAKALYLKVCQLKTEGSTGDNWESLSAEAKQYYRVLADAVRSAS